MAGYVTVRRYLDPVEAHMDRARLESQDVPARVIEPTSFNPLLTGAAGGVTLDVRAEDAQRADRILADVSLDVTHSYRAAAAGDPDAEEDDGGPDQVRCPRCETEYCSFERPRLRGLSPGGATSGALFLLAPFLLLGPKRWRCQRCEHVWDDAGAGPSKMTRLRPGDPVPIFRLRRAHPGMGLLLGLVAGTVLGLAISSWVGSLLFVLAPVIGWILGRSIAVDVCSEPRCRAPLPAGAEICRACKGSIAGRVRSAAEHHAASADVRRELAALHEEDDAKPARVARRRAAR